MKKVIGIMVILASLVLTGCVVAPVIPPPGLVFTSISAPLDTDMDNTEISEKKGRASCVNILGLLAFGNASTVAAARDGNIDIVEHADYSYWSILGLFSQYTTIVYGK